METLLGAHHRDGENANIYWDEVLRKVLRIEGVCPIGEKIKALIQVEGNIQEKLNELVGELHQGMVRRRTNRITIKRKERGSKTRRRGRLRKKVVKYACTQELYKKNLSILAELIL